VPSRIRQTQGQGEFPAHSFKYSPLEQVRTLYVGFCQGLFAAAPPGSYRWTPSLEDTEIIITDESPIHVDTIGKRPAISFTRGPVQSYSLGQDDMLSYDFETGKKKKSILVPGTMSINSCSRSDIESERIAWIVAEQLWLHREMLMKAGFFEIGRQFIVGAPSPAGSIVTGDSGDEWYATTVSSPFQFYRTSQITPLGREILEAINTNMSLSRVVNQPAAQPQPTLNPVPQFVSTSSAATATSAATADGVPLHLGVDVIEGLVSNTNTGAGTSVPHPLNPNQMVVVKAARPNGPGLRAPGINGRAIPIQRVAVEQSGVPATVVTRPAKV